MDLVSVVLVLIVGYAIIVIGGLRKRVTTLEGAVGRVQGQLDDAARQVNSQAASAESPIPLSDPIDIEPFVD